LRTVIVTSSRQRLSRSCSRGKRPLFSAATKAGEGAQGYVFLVGGAPRQSLELLAGQADQALKIPFPELLRRRAIAGLELRKPSTD
jgi:hypothetical protein